MSNSEESIKIALAWCLAWGGEREPKFGMNAVAFIKKAIQETKVIPSALQAFGKEVEKLDNVEFPKTTAELCKTFEALQKDNPQAWNTSIGLVYGGATKIKGYVFEASKLPDIRGASALLDRINLVDLPAFFGKDQKDTRYDQQCEDVRIWLDKCSAKETDNLKLSDALIPELIIYSTGGNILAFCPAAYVDDLANAIEKRYTEETLTANSCAVGDSFRLLEIRFGLLQNPLENTLWLDWYQKNHENEIVEAYFRDKEEKDLREEFKNRKSFNELAGKLASQFNSRRSGNESLKSSRPNRRYPPIFETHPYLKRDEGDRRSAILHVRELPGEPWFSETLARKRLMGQISKREFPEGQLPEWYEKTKLGWKPGKIESWVLKFEKFLKKSEHRDKYYQGIPEHKLEEARSLTEIGNASNSFVAYIYADGNNMGGYIQKILTPQKYQQFSKDILEATQKSVYEALAKHLHPHKLEGLTGTEHQNRNRCIVHPFEILAIGGDDVMLIVPADKALDIAKTIGEEFERRLATSESYKVDYPSCLYHRYCPETAQPAQSKLSMSTGVLITALATPIYYAENLTNQLLKSAKKRAKDLKKHGYYGGTVDFMVMKSVTMISSNIGEFRRQGLTKSGPKEQKLKLYAAPYTLHELGGLIKTVEALKKSEFPRSQLYQIRSLLGQGKNTAMLNYRYFRVRLQGEVQQKLLKEQFEEAWCGAKTNKGNLAPWMSLKEGDQKEAEQEKEKVTYETIWRDLVDLYPFIEESKEKDVTQETKKVGDNA